jgi:NAD(P)-dependent dehydrogenase (short-subunit alcohol dehydrogenase family)
MNFVLKPLRDQVIVITGASSGIGLATARRAARQEAKLVLAARNGEALSEIVREIEAEGGEAVSVVADVGVRDDVQRIADAAVERFGGFDTWVNDAAVAIYGRLEQVSDEDHRRLFDTNFWGVVHGSLVACEVLKKRGGALINVGSVLSDVAIPLQGMYTASKHAVKGFTDSLRIELAAEGAPVSVTLIKPGSIDTPYPHHARNYMDKEPKLPPPVYAPELVADAILHAAQKPVRDVFVGGSGRVMSSLGKNAPRLYDRISSRSFFDSQKADEPPREPTGALYRPGLGGDVRGDYPGRVNESSVYTQTALHPVLAGAAVAVGIAALAWLVASALREERPRGWGERARELERRLARDARKTTSRVAERMAERAERMRARVGI